MKPKIIRRKKGSTPKNDPPSVQAEKPKTNPIKAKRQKREVKPKIKRPRLSTELLISEMASTTRQDLERMLRAPSQVQLNDDVEGTVIRISEDLYILDIGAKSEAFLWKDQCRQENLTIGTRVQAQVTSINSNGIVLSQCTLETANRTLLQAKEEGTPIEAKVIGVNNGGYRLQAFDIAGFCPKSQIDIVSRADEMYLNKTFSFLIKDINKSEFIGVRRPLLEADQKEKQRQFLASLQQGSTHRGTIRSLTNFGAFISIEDQVEGLLPKKKIPSHLVLKEGEHVQIRIDHIDIENNRLGLSLNRRDPWQDLGTVYQTNTPYVAKVTERIEHGLLISLEIGLIGLLHNSKITKDPPPLGSEVTIYIHSFDIAARKMSLSLQPSVVVQEKQGPTTTLADMMKGLFQD